MAELLTTPVTKTTVTDKFQITGINLSFYCDGKNMEACRAHISIRKGTGDAPDFITHGTENIMLTSEETLTLLGNCGAMENIMPKIVLLLKNKNIV